MEYDGATWPASRQKEIGLLGKFEGEDGRRRDGH
jgi:hypothetical protein